MCRMFIWRFSWSPRYRCQRTSLMGTLGLGGAVAPLAYKGALKPLADKDVNVVFLPVYSQDFNPIEYA